MQCCQILETSGSLKCQPVVAQRFATGLKETRIVESVELVAEYFIDSAQLVF